MRKALAGAAVIVSVLMFVVGLIVCMCETPSLEQQIRNMGMGFVIMGVSLLLGLVGNAYGTN